jgi:nucleotide-binding universal stress UspA family protein
LPRLRRLAGLPPPPKRWQRSALSLEDVLRLIRQHHEQRQPLAASRVAPSLRYAAQHLFGSWRAAIGAAGLDYGRVCLKLTCSDEDLLARLRTLARERPLMAYDGSPAARRALHGFAASGLAREQPIHVATVGDDGALAWETAEAGCRLLREHGVAATAHNIVSTLSVADALLDRRQKLGAGLMVLGAYTRSRFSRLFWGSVTQEILQKTVVPLFMHY